MNFSILFSQQQVSHLASAHFFLDYYQAWETASQNQRLESARRDFLFPDRSSSTVVLGFLTRSIWNFCWSANIIFICFNWTHDLDFDFEANYTRGKIFNAQRKWSFSLEPLDMDRLAIIDRRWDGQPHAEYSFLWICPTDCIVLNGTYFRLSCCWRIFGFDVPTNQWWNWNNIPDVFVILIICYG